MRSGKPDDVPQDIWDAAVLFAGPASNVYSPHNTRVKIARAIMAEREATDKRMAELLRDPVAVRLNWMRGGVDASAIIADEREACARIAEDQAGWIRLGGPHAWHGADGIAEAIRKRT